MNGGWMTAQEAASANKGCITAWTLNKLCREGKIKHGSNGRRHLFRQSDIDAYFLLQVRKR